MTLNADSEVTAHFTTPADGGAGGGAPPAVSSPAPIAPAPPSTSPAKPKPLHCGPHRRKVKAHGKAKCVRKKSKHGKHARG